MYLFSNTLVANFAMVPFIENMTNISITWAFPSGMWTIAKFTVFNKVSNVLVVSVMTRLIEVLFKNLINVGGKLRFENFSGMFTCFLSSMACTNCFEKSTTYSHGGYQIHIRNLTFLIQSQNHKNCDPIAAVYKKLVAKNGYVFPRVTVFWKLVENRS